MSRFHRIALLAGLVVGLICLPFLQRRGLAQAGGAARPPAFDPSSATSIQKFIDGQVGVMTSKGASAAAQESARDAIADTPRPTAGAGGGDPTPVPYAALYATALNSAVVGVLKDSAIDVRAKLNLAIAVARVAEHTQSANLAPAVQALMSDKHPALQLWGLKSVRPILPGLLATGAAGPIIGQVQGVAKQHPKDTAIAQECYEALSAPARGMTQAALKPVVGAMLALAQGRASQYGPDQSPEDPAVDVTAINYLMSPHTWPVLAAQDQQAAMQLIVDLITNAARRSKADRAHYDQYKEVVLRGADGVWVVANLIKDADLTSIAGSARQILGGQNPDLEVAIQRLVPAIKAVPQFNNIKVPVGNGVGGGGVAADAKPPAN
jgi:hypothetical protein